MSGIYAIAVARPRQDSVWSQTLGGAKTGAIIGGGIGIPLGLGLGLLAVGRVGGAAAVVGYPLALAMGIGAGAGAGGFLGALIGAAKAA